MNMQKDLSKPVHLGLILDGNRRWAKSHGVTAAEGHKAGYNNLKVIAKAAFDMGVEYVSAYVFSTENWQRDRTEVADIMGILSWVLKHEVKQFNKEGIRLRVIGSKSTVSKTILTAIRQAEQLTEQNTQGTILLCLDYSGQQEIVDAVKNLKDHGVEPHDITPEQITKYLYAPDVPAPDLIIRTSGEQRLSNFLLWQSSYSELMFEPKNWPDYTTTDLQQAIGKYGQLQRRYGK